MKRLIIWRNKYKDLIKFNFFMGILREENTGISPNSLTA
jgi:hypothetical protein